MSDEYTSYAEAKAVPVLDHHDALPLSEQDQQVIRDLVASSPDIAVRAAHLYDRKGYFATDSFDQAERNYHGRDTDEIVVQVTLVVRDYENREAHKALTGVRTSVQTARREAEVAARQAQVAKAQADLDAAQARLDALRNG